MGCCAAGQPGRGRCQCAGGGWRPCGPDVLRCAPDCSPRHCAHCMREANTRSRAVGAPRNPDVPICNVSTLWTITQASGTQLPSQLHCTLSTAGKGAGGPPPVGGPASVTSMSRADVTSISPKVGSSRSHHMSSAHHRADSMQPDVVATAWHLDPLGRRRMMCAMAGAIGVAGAHAASEPDCTRRWQRHAGQQPCAATGAPLSCTGHLLARHCTPKLTLFCHLAAPSSEF